ncbi:MAG: DNA methyltransferase [Flavobacteriaceae bacterium]|nr:DNA methyltransferase [Flavobacteriaceae bacterium]
MNHQKNKPKDIQQLDYSYPNKAIKKITDFVNLIDQGLSSYLVYMTLRLHAMKRVIKDTGSIYLQCDPTASHYLKLIMDLIFGRKNFRNEIVWHYYNKYSAGKKSFGKNYDQILFYSKTNDYKFIQQREKRDKPIKQLERVNIDGVLKNKKGEDGKVIYRIVKDKKIDSVWSIPCLQPASKEKLGYPTQKPLALLERIIKASSNEGGVVLDPFCGCGTTIDAAESLKRQWIGIDIAKFSTGLMKNRILKEHQNKFLENRIEIYGAPRNIEQAKKLAQKDPFEFEKWACGLIGAKGMYKRLGQKGPDGGIDGVIEFPYSDGNQKFSYEMAIVQVKGGKVEPDSVKALYQNVEDSESKCGIFVCFEQYMNTVNKHLKQDTYNNFGHIYPFIQGFSIEQLLNNQKPDLL